MRDYFDNRWSPETAIGPDDFVRVPTAISVFEHNFVAESDMPRE